MIEGATAKLGKGGPILMVKTNTVESRSNGAASHGIPPSNSWSFQLVFFFFCGDYRESSADNKNKILVP